MQPSSICPTCHTEVKPTDYFCFNCGKNLKPKPLSTSVSSLVVLYAISIFLPPFGVFKGLKYLQEKDSQRKIIGLIAVLLTITSLIITIMLTFNIANTVNEQVNSQLQNFGSF